MDVKILNAGLKEIERIYNNSMYDPNEDLYRITDIIHALDENHWKGKQWLVDELTNYIYDDDAVVRIDAAWYGLTGYLLKKEFPSIKLKMYDADPDVEHISENIFGNRVKISKAELLKSKDVGVYINTSIEHIDKSTVEVILHGLPRNALVALQSNNYEELDSHINCSTSIENFTISVEKHFRKVLFTGELDLGDFTRYMIIGIKK